MRVLRIIRAILSEIFDESAYRRYCERGELAMSWESYAGFLKESSATKDRRVKCC